MTARGFFIAVVLSLVAVILPRTALAARASLYLSPSSKTVTVGDSFTVGLYVSADSAINAAEATLTFPADKLRVSSISKSGIFSLWAVEPNYSNSSGRITFSGGLPSPGYKGTSGKILTVTFKATGAGKPKVSITGGTVLANDGKGTNILKSSGSGTYTVNAPAAPPEEPPAGRLAPTVGSSSHPDQAKWYNSSSVSASWQGGQGVQGYSLVFDNTADTVPAEKVSTTQAAFSNPSAADGVSYLHVRAKYETGWSSAVHFKYQIDTLPPEQFTIAIAGDPELTFEAKDATSGVDHYELALDEQAFSTVVSPYVTPVLPPGRHTVKVRAFDKAGNYREASTEFTIEEYPQPILIDLTPVAVGEEPIIVRGFSKAQDTIRLTIDGQDIGTYPVADHLDTQPPQPPPEGTVAWKLEVSTDLGDGEHEIVLTAIGPDGQVSTQTPPVKFRVATNAVRLGSYVAPTMLIVNILVVLLVLALLTAIFFAIRYYRLRRQTRRLIRPDMLRPVHGRKHNVPSGKQPR